MPRNTIRYTGRTKTLVVSRNQQMGPRPGYGRKRRKNRKARLFRVPRPGGASLIVPIKVGYTYDVIGTGASSLDFRQDVGLNRAPIAFLTRYSAIFEYIRINKCRIEITCPYNIGQHNVGTQSLYRMWSKKAFATLEPMPGDISEWLNLQTAKRTTFSGKTNSINYYFTPGYETSVQPLNVAVTQLRLLYKQWQTIKPTQAEMTPHIGILAQMVRLDGSNIGNTNIFKVNVTLYCQMRGLKQL